MGPENNIDSILALEKQIKEGLGDVIQLKRTRNSLLNISTLMPPELLGQVFRWNVIPDDDFGELKKGSYNFLLVCHHWFEIASGTPELWAYWGNTLKQWSRRYQRSGIAPLDLVLQPHHYGYDEDPVPFDGPLRDAVRSHVICDSVRSVHLRGPETELLRSVISSLTLDGEGVRDSSIESLMLEYTYLDVSKFLTRHRFPKLRVLHLLMCVEISPWDRLKLQATSLTTLLLGFPGVPNSPTTSQLLSILTSYPNLQDLSLCQVMVPGNIGSESVFRVPLRQLRKLSLEGDFCSVFQLLDQLEHPDKLDLTHLDLTQCVGEAVSELLEPYLRNRIRRDGGFQSRLAILVSCADDYISFEIGILGKHDTLPTPLGYGHPSVSFMVRFGRGLPHGTIEKLCTLLIAAAPREHVVKFTGGPNIPTVRDLPITMPNVESLHLVCSVISDRFLRPDPFSDAKLLPSLRHLYLYHFTLQNDDDWGPLITYLTHQASGDQTFSLLLCERYPPVPPEVVREIENLVDEFTLG